MKAHDWSKFPPGAWLDDEGEDNRQRRRCRSKRRRTGRVKPPKGTR